MCFEVRVHTLDCKRILQLYGKQRCVMGLSKSVLVPEIGSRAKKVRYKSWPTRLRAWTKMPCYLIMLRVTKVLEKVPGAPDAGN